MFNIENILFTEIATELRSQFSGIKVSGEYVKSPAGFPFVSIVESDNYMSHLDNSGTEKYSTVMYEINVYSNKTSGKKAEARSIISVIDEMMYARNFTRLSMSPAPNLEDSTIYRITARYRAETDGDRLFRI